MNLKKVILATSIVATGFTSNVFGQTPITETNYRADMHSAYMSVPYTQDKSGARTIPRNAPKYFIRAENPLKNVYTTMFEVSREGVISGTGFYLSKTSVDHSYCPHFSLSYNDNDQLVFSTSSYPGKFYPAIFKFGSATFDSDVVVNGKLSCKDELDVTELNTKSIRTEDITVDMNNAADYVFDENYNLRSLSEVESYVKENKHLPGIPSAAEMSENGMSVSQMSNLLLEKVEELTLHMIELEKENKALKAEMESLKK